MDVKNVETFLSEMRIEHKKKNEIDDKMFFEDKFLDKYSEPGYIFKISSNKNNSRQFGGKKSDYDNFISNIDENPLEEISKIEKRIHQKLGMIFSKSYNKDKIRQLIEDYVLNKYKLKAYHFFAIGTESYNKRKPEKNQYINQLPDKSIKASQIFIQHALLFSDHLKHIENVINYTNFIIKTYLKDGGDVIIYWPLTFRNEKFYDYFLKLVGMFETTEIFYPTFFMNIKMNGFTILKNYNTNNTNKSVSSEELATFYKKMEKFPVGEFAVYDNLVTIKYTDENMFNVISHKYMSYSMLKYVDQKLSVR